MPRLHHVQLAMPAGEEDAARAFYAAVLGMREVAQPPALAARGGAWFRDGALELHLGVEEPFAPARTAHPGIQVDDLDAACARLADVGIATRPDGELSGHRRVAVDDPFGNRVELLEPLLDRDVAGGGRSGVVARLRAQVGTAQLHLPSAAVCVFDAEDRLLLAHHVVSGRWGTPGGAVEPDESPADAAVREAAEELGVTVRLLGVAAVDGPHHVHYPNGDHTSYVCTSFGAEVVDGAAPRPDEVELSELRWCTLDEALALPTEPWLARLLPGLFGWRRDGVTRF